MSLLDNLSAYLKCDETSGNLSDATGNGNTFVNNNGATFVTGKINNGVALAKTSSQYFSISDAAQVGLNPSTDFSRWLWMNLASIPTFGPFGDYFLFSKSNEATNNRSYEIYYRNYTTPGFRFVLSPDGSENSIYDIPYTLSVNTPVHVIFSWEASISTLTVYVNGSSLGTFKGFTGGGDPYDITSVYNSNAPTYIGGYLDDNNPSGLEFTDAIYYDEIGFRNSVTTSSEASQLYNGGAGLSYPFVVTTQETLTGKGSIFPYADKNSLGRSRITVIENRNLYGKSHVIVPNTVFISSRKKQIYNLENLRPIIKGVVS